MLAAATTITVLGEALGLIIASLGVITAVAFGTAYFRGRRGQTLSSLQADTITALEAANNEKAERITRLEEQVGDLQEQVTVLRELVTQTAKVDMVRNEQAKSFQSVMRRLDEIDRHIAARDSQ